MSRRTVRSVTSRRSASSAPLQNRRDCSSASKPSRRAEVWSTAASLARIEDRSCPQYRLGYLSAGAVAPHTRLGGGDERCPPPDDQGRQEGARANVKNRFLRVAD